LLFLVSALLAHPQSSPIHSAAPQDSSGYFYKMSIQAYSTQRYDLYLEYTQKVLAVHPDNYTLQYNLASAYALNKDTLNALKVLNELVDKGLGLVAENDPDFTDLQNLPAFKTLVKKIQKVKTPVKSSKKAFTIPEKDLFPRGIAYDPQTKNLYVSSLYKNKIVKIDRKGQVSDFVAENQDSIGPTIGLRLNAQNRILWVLSSYGAPNEKTPREVAGTSYVYKYNIDDGKLIKKYAMLKPRGHFLTEVVEDKAGNLYIANSGMRTIYRLDAQKDTLEKLINLRQYPQLTGLALSPDDKYLFVAYANGLLRIDLATQKITSLAHPNNILLVGCDGLYFYDNSLIAIQNFLNRIIRFDLNPDYSGIIGYKIIESNNPDFAVPSTGVITGKTFYYIANSQINNLDRTGKVQNPEQLKDILILKTKL